MDTQEVLEKLGTALYLHIKLAEDAADAYEAVEYLEKVGVFTEDAE